MKKTLISLGAIYIIFLTSATNTMASSPVVSESAQINRVVNSNDSDFRVITLEKYLESHHSPLSEYARCFIDNADKYDLDWRFVPAITGVESTFGKRIPTGSYNAYGWANGEYYFESWEDSIEHVSRVLKEKYVEERGLTTIDEIARVYAPPSSTWSWKVKFFIDKIEPMPVEFTI